MHTNPKEQGFTLIELLVVIAIIGLLASVVLASLSTARQKGRDARRIADLREVQTALELYYSDHNAYPAVTSQSSISSALSSSLVPTYISSVSDDPLGGSYHYVYLSTSGGTFYCLGSVIEGTAPNSTCNTTSLGATLSGVQYSVGP